MLVSIKTLTNLMFRVEVNATNTVISINVYT